MKYLLAIILLSGCTVDVNVPQPNVTVDCVLVELPGGQVRTDCDAGDDAGRAGEE